MTLTEFLLARIAEDERRVAGIESGEGDPPFFWGPDRVRSECEARRRIVDELGESVDYGFEDWDAGVIARRVLTALALPYADHPDYQQEWRP